MGRGQQIHLHDSEARDYIVDGKFRACIDYHPAGLWRNVASVSLSRIPVGERSIAAFSRFVNLQSLDLSSTDLTEIPEGIDRLTNLQRLDVSHNSRLTQITACIGQLTNLNWLNLSYNPALTALPRQFWRLRNLITLNLSHTGLTEIPAEIGQLTNLTTLSLGNIPRLTTLPEDFGMLRNLNSLDLSRTGLTMLPVDFGNLENLSSLDLSHNPAIDCLDQVSNLRLKVLQLEGMDHLCNGVRAELALMKRDRGVIILPFAILEQVDEISYLK